MSLYNQIFGINPLAPAVIAMLDMDPEKIPRIRDAWYWDGELVVYTRTGGANRETYAKENDWMRSHPLFLRDQDDEYDSTYAMWFYKLPKDIEELKPKLDSLPRAPRPSERWQGLLDKMKKDTERRQDVEVKRAVELGEKLYKAIEDVLNKEGR